MRSVLSRPGRARSGKQVNTGYDSRGRIFGFRRLNEDARMTLGIQRSFMNDASYPQNSGRVDLGRSLTRIGDWTAPRSGTRALLGNSWEDAGGWATESSPWHAPTRAGKNSHESRHKAVTSEDFDLDDLGLSVRMEADDPWGELPWSRMASGVLVSGGYKFTFASSRLRLGSGASRRRCRHEHMPCT